MGCYELFCKQEQWHLSKILDERVQLKEKTSQKKTKSKHVVQIPFFHSSIGIYRLQTINWLFARFLFPIMAVPSFLFQLNIFRCPEALCEGRHFAWGKVWLGGGVG